MSDTSNQAIKKTHFLNAEEQNCFDILCHSIDHSMIILPKVQVEDLFEAPVDQSDETFWSNFKNLSQKHLDFLVCNRKISSLYLSYEFEEEIIMSKLVKKKKRYSTIF